MKWPGECTVIIPCLNEASTIGRLVSEIRPLLPTVYVVDDGSRDRTSAMALEAGARVIRHDRTMGKGAALSSGLRAAINDGFIWALAMDGDGQHLPADIPAFLSCADSGSAAMVVGNRMANCRPMPWVRRLVNKWMSRRLSNLSGCSFPDSQCGFRLFRLDVWASLPIESSHYEIESELLVKFARVGHRIDFVPIRVVYGNERSKIHPLTDTVRWLRWWWRSRNKPADTAAIKPAASPACEPVT